MSQKTPSVPDLNSWFEDELRQQYHHDHRMVDESWKDVFDSNGGPANGATLPAAAEPPAASPAVTAALTSAPTATAPAQAPAPATAPAPAGSVAKATPQVGPSQQLVPLRGAAARIAANMELSLAVPTATSQRVIPVKVMDENRRIINQHRALTGKSKISFSQIIGFAILKSLKAFPQLNDAFLEGDGDSFRVINQKVNLGIAVDVAGQGGNRSLVVPSIKNAGEMTFAQYLDAFEDLVARARKNKLTVDDFHGTTLSLTNPGTVGTSGSVPRLMPGQGCIIAAGAIGYPAEYQGVSPEMRATIGLSATMTITCTYDHRVIQGAESGMFLARLQELLNGAGDFYEEIFLSLRLPHHPLEWEADRQLAIPGASGTSSRHREIAKEAAVLQLINAYRVRGHLIADLDPLGKEPGYHPELDPATYGLTIWDLDREFLTGSLGALTGDAAPKPIATLREILETLRQTYCGKIGCEYMNIQTPEQKSWLQQRMEPLANSWPLGAEQRIRILQRILYGELFENFLQTRFLGQKRFSLEGAETAIAILDELLERCGEQNVHEVVIGMAHRGRLNILANTVGKPLSQIFSEFEGNPDPNSAQGSGDVKYHLGATGIHRAVAGKEVIVSVAPNPSHLEAVDPVVEGIVRPKQDRLGDTARKRVIPVLIHGDAAFAGQGVVTETLNLSQLTGYTTGGTIHLIINNQIGFTTRPDESRSTPYCTDVARTVQAPIFHVNGDDPEAAIRALQIAFDFRQQFGKDVVLDMICYRRHGHNETDDPSYTQPLLYRKIKDHAPVGTLYAQRLEREKIVSLDQVDKLRKRISARLEEGFEEAKQNAVRFEVQELGVVDTEHLPTFCPRTAADRALLEKVVDGLTTIPADFHLHPKLRGFLEKRKEALRGGSIDWALAEALAFGTLVLEGTPVRLSGQDSSRGTFSQRHLELYDYEDGSCHIPMQHLDPHQARFEVWDSSLSEFAVMGFEFGYSVGDPLTLVLWEAQFGDFVNGAQIMVDQFITCAEVKWGQPSGLVLLLPHGYEGQGPEHSSARIERFLILCAENNMSVVNCTTPAQYFHVLRRQMYGGHDRRGLRKPLVIFTPKSLLRHPRVVNKIEDLATGGFRPLIGETDPRVTPDKVSRVLICAGRIYYDLIAEREEREAWHVAILRLEQYYPFPKQELQDQLMRYSPTCDIVWVQDEPRNMGAWRFIRTPTQPMLDASRRKLRYIGRPEAASPATGSYKRHQQEHKDIMDSCFHLDQIAPVKKVRVVRHKKPAK
ncbi:MAG: multifunctional oxoglutarate decarboxylase/oxoglutarate dehydrogenase thiamine pyrophosphate-binding subunit/dihydrolipoyllysine-residue succinyltransferase subunit [Bryobacterales bacterium]|nr:multifunctional oxoglutarate decarboxylase/oxoglutarate dehydrogenase thiamine pyrophosphate-binding subunit/dihydrolipoyllysine-residue succinyltransferase subunit [Bryobacterales bacterium]